MLEIEKKRSDTVVAVIFGDTVVEDEPALRGLDGNGADAYFPAVPHASPGKDERTMRQEPALAVESEAIEEIYVDRRLDAVKKDVLSADLFREKAGVLVVDSGRGDENGKGEPVESAGEEILGTDRSEGDSRWSGCVDGGIEHVVGSAYPRDARVLDARISRIHLVFERRARDVGGFGRTFRDAEPVLAFGVSEDGGVILPLRPVEEADFPSAVDRRGVENRLRLPWIGLDRLEDRISAEPFERRVFFWRIGDVRENLPEVALRDAGGRVGGTVVEGNRISLYCGSGREDNVADLSIFLVFFLGDEKRRARLPKDFPRVLRVEQDRLDGEYGMVGPVVLDIGVEDEPAFFRSDRWGAELDMVVVVPLERQGVGIEFFIPSVPLRVIPEVLFRVERCDGDLGRREIGVRGKNRPEFSVDLLREECHRFRVERSDEVPL